MKKMAFPFVILLALTLSACQYIPSRPAPSPTPLPSPLTETTSVTKKKAVYELTAPISNQTALELLQADNQVETKDYGTAGQFVTSINGLAGSNEYYWAFYLNGAYAEKGASQTMLSKGDTIKFVYEAVTPTK